MSQSRIRLTDIQSILKVLLREGGVGVRYVACVCKSALGKRGVRLIRIKLIRVSLLCVIHVCFYDITLIGISLLGERGVCLADVQLILEILLREICIGI